jgi:ABC-type polar amino acid transport system ATPase subunit
LKSEPIIEVRGVYKSFGRVEALLDVSLDVYPGEVLFVFGPSGGARAPSCVASTGWKRWIAAPSWWTGSASPSIRLAREGMTMVVVSHEMGFAKAAADRMVFLAGGRVVETGATEELYNNPKEERTRMFLSQILY